MGKRIYKAICLLAVLVLLCSMAVFTVVSYSSLESQAVRQLRNDADYLSLALKNQGLDYFEQLGSQSSRITLIGTDGAVLYDNWADESAMENHLDRVEVQEALKTGFGTERRTSETLAEETIYVAVCMENGQVLRISTTQRSVWSLLLSSLAPALLVAVLVLILASVLADRVTKKIIAPINALDLEHPQDNQCYEELSPLLRNMVQLHRTIDRQLQEARQKQEEFRVITSHMSEGILIIDPSANVLSCNGAALRLLGAEAMPEHTAVLALNRSEAFRTAVGEVLEGKRSEQVLKNGEQTLQILANPVMQDENVAGAVLLVLDVTEMAQREALRREFSANVSHELKTPLTSISGFAELMKTGMVAREDVMDFSQTIYDEAQRLIRLVQDIIRVSSLDENRTDSEPEPVELYQLAQEEVRRLKPLAEKNRVTVTVRGEPTVIHGSSAILREIVANLCGNAILYNRPGGTVEVTVENRTLTVKDTGIGIPAASQGRVFERFYRVDKSHSREVAGTGLGLSIVKHGVQFHNARIALESTEGKGTTITVWF